MSTQNWSNAGWFAGTAFFSGLAAGVVAGRAEPTSWTVLAAGLAVASGLCWLVLSRLLAGQLARYLALVSLPLLELASLGGWAWEVYCSPMVWYLLYWGIEWLAWLVRLMRSGALAREVDIFPGLALGGLVLAWLGGWLLASVMGLKMFWLAALCLLLASLAACRLRLAYEGAGPEALRADTFQGRLVAVQMQLSCWQDAREAVALLGSLAVLGLFSGHHWKEWELCRSHVSSGWLASWAFWAMLPLMIGIWPILVGNHPVRVAGWLPYVFWCMVASQIWLNIAGQEQRWAPMLVVQSAWGCGMVVIAARLIVLVPASAAGGWLSLAGLIAWGAMSLGSWLGTRLPEISRLRVMGAALAAVAVHSYWLREWLELSAAPLAWLVYRIRAVGPGRHLVPWRGPLLVVANHASWMDPFWLGKVIPRRLTPMMTSDFYDLPGLYWLMRYVLRVIRVEEASARREAPELEEAVARLDAGECVVIFPEGRLRRDEGRLLTHFQRGIWLVLQKRPSTPVVPCWLEGSWGSFFSWKDGPPMKNKRFDWGRCITVVIGEPIIVPTELLADHRATRRFLEEAVVRLRQFLGLPNEPTRELNEQAWDSSQPSPSSSESATTSDS